MKKVLLLVGVPLLVGFVVLLFIMLLVYKGRTWERNLIMRTAVPPNEVRAFLRDDVTVEEKQDIEQFVRNMKEVKSVRYSSKEEAMQEYREIFKDDEGLLEEIEGNPLPASLLISTLDPKYNSTVAKQLESRPEVSTDDVTGSKEIKLPSSDAASVDRFHKHTLAIRLSVLSVYVVLSGLILLFTFLIFRGREVVF